MRGLLSTVQIGLMSLLLSSVGVAELPTADEILAIHRTNEEPLSRLHLQWTHIDEVTEASGQTARKQAAEKAKLTKEIRQMKSEDLRLQIGNQTYVGEAALRFLEQSGAIFSRRELENALVDSPPRRPIISTFELFRSGDRYQIRSHRFPNDEAAPANWSFAEGPLNEATLLTTYAEYDIFSWSPTETPAGRRWLGRARQGQVSPQHFGQSSSTRLPPGTALLEADWGGRHPYDHFFSRPAEEYRVVRQEEVDGRQLTVVDVRVPIGTPPSLWLGYRGWLDLERGAVPVRMGHRQVTKNAPAHVFDGDESFAETTATQVVRELPGGVFYPAKVTRERLAPDPEAPAGEPARPIVHARDIWTASLIEIGPDRPPEFFALPFPANIPVYDNETGRLIGALPPQPLVKVGQKAPKFEVARWIDGRKRSLESFRGQVVVLEFWDVASEACKELVPIRNDLRKEFANQPVVFLDIHVATEDPAALPPRIAEFQKKSGWNGTTAIDSGTMADNSATTVAYGAKYLPLLVIIDREGHVAYVDPQDLGVDEEQLVLPRAEEELEQKMNAILQARFEVAEESWPVDETLSDAEQLAIHRRVELRYLKRVIQTTLDDSKRH